MEATKRPEGLTLIGSMRLYAVGMGNHFPDAPCSEHLDAKWLNDLQLRILECAEAHARERGNCNMVVAK